MDDFGNEIGLGAHQWITSCGVYGGWWVDSIDWCLDV